MASQFQWGLWTRYVCEARLGRLRTINTSPRCLRGAYHKFINHIILKACCGELDRPVLTDACSDATFLFNTSAYDVDVHDVHDFNMLTDAFCVLRGLRNSDKKLERMLPGI